MNPDQFTPDEQLQLLECLAAVERLSIYHSPEFDVIFGLSQENLRIIRDAFPNWDLYDEGAEDSDDSWLALNNTFAFIMNGTEEEKHQMRAGLSFDEPTIVSLFSKFQTI